MIFIQNIVRMLHQIHPNKIRQVLFLALVLILGIIIFKELYFMLTAFLGSITLYIIMRKWMMKMSIRWKMKKWLGALILILLSLIIAVLPTVWLISIAFNKIMPYIQQPEILKNAFAQINAYLTTNFNIDILNKSNVEKITNQIVPFAQNTIGGTLNGLLSLVLMYITLYFMLVNNLEIELWIKKHMPLKNQNAEWFISEFKSLVYSNALGIPIVALIQGIVGMIGYIIFGVQGFVLMGILTAICSVIPMVGPTLVWGPLALFLMSQGNSGQALGVALWGFIVVGSVDNIARFVLQKKLADIHPLITIFGVIVGISLFGFIGIIFGPLLLSMFILLVKVFTDEFGIADADEMAAESETEEAT